MTNQGQPKEAVMVVYYIPNGAGLKSPPAMMRRNGFVSYDGSCWFGHKAAVAGLKFDGWAEAGARWNVVPFTEVQWPDIRRIAEACLTKHIADVRESLTDGMAKSAKRLADAEKLMSAKGVKRASSFTRGQVTQAKRRLVQAQEAALIFDLLGETASLFDALRSEVMAAEQAAFAVKALASEKAAQFESPIGMVLDAEEVSGV